MSLLLLHPLWLLALLPVAAGAVLAWRQRTAGGWEAVLSPAILGFVSRHGYLGPPERRWPVLLPFAIAALAALALSGPARLREDGIAFERLDPLVLAIDLSPSVTRGGGLADAQAAAAQVLQSAGGRPVGLLLYGADAYLASAPTSDAASLESLIAVLSPDILPVSGSRPDIALSQASDLFGAPGMPGLGGTDILLVSDGGGAGPRAEEEAATLRARGARVWALTLDTPGLPPEAPGPDPEGLAAITRAGGGASAPARDPRPLLARIAEARTVALSRSPEAPLVVRDFGRLVLLLALPMALLLFRPARRTG